jgi:chemotaxis protein MotB
MRISSVTFRWIGLAAAGLTLSGCVSQDQYNALKLERDRMAEQLVTAQHDAAASKSAADAYKTQLDALAANGSASTGLVANLSAQVAALQAERDELNRKYADALNRPVVGPSALPPKLTDELNAFAQQNPDLVDFDSARGIVKFKSDVVFNVGDATLTAKARDVIDRFAKILNSASASQYELMVAGHTDNAPVHNPATINAGHKDNWYLSSHRAISVSSELQKTGVSPSRIGVVGYADQHPIASNASESGKAQNRRVEVLILPTTVKIAAPSGVATSGKKDSAKTAGARLNKDSASTPTGPVLNK